MGAITNGHFVKIRNKLCKILEPNFPNHGGFSHEMVLKEILGLNSGL